MGASDIINMDGQDGQDGRKAGRRGRGADCALRDKERGIGGLWIG